MNLETPLGKHTVLLMFIFTKTCELKQSYKNIFLIYEFYKLAK